MNPGQKRVLEIKLQYLAEQLTLAALERLSCDRTGLMEQFDDSWGLTPQEESAAADALSKFFSDVADGLGRAWHYGQPPHARLKDVAPPD